MLYSTAVLATLVSAFTTVGQAGPVTQRNIAPKLPSTDGFHGFDGSLVTISEAPLNLTATVSIMKSGPEIRILPRDKFSSDATAVVEPSTPASDKFTRLTRLKRFIFGQDNRYYWGLDAFPYHSVGRLTWSSGTICSGALVGPRHVLTAKHCLPSDPSTVTGRFSPSFDGKEREGGANVLVAVAAQSADADKGDSCGTKFDWAVLVLDDDSLGKRLGWFGVRNPESKYFDQAVFYHMGYPGDIDGGSKPMLMTHITIYGNKSLDCDGTGPFYTDTDAMGGQSGGPQWLPDEQGNRWISGALSVGVSWGTGDGYSGWASGAEMIDAINQLRGEFP